MARANDFPWFAFYTQDWLLDEALAACGLAAQGLWIHLLCRMHRSPERGFLLKANGSKAQADTIAKWAAITEAEAKQLLSELEAEAVYSTDDAGRLYSRRMVKDEKQRRSKQEAGRKGGKRSRPQAKPKQKPTEYREQSTENREHSTDKDPPQPPSPSDAHGAPGLLTGLDGVVVAYGKEPAQRQQAFDQLLRTTPFNVIRLALVELNRELEGKGKSPLNLAAYFLPIVERHTKAHAETEAKRRQTAAENKARAQTEAEALPPEQATQHVAAMREKLQRAAAGTPEEQRAHAEKVRAQAKRLKEGAVEDVPEDEIAF